MTTLQTLEMALEALEPDRNRDHWEVARDRQKAITDIRQQIALLKQQSADEPVAWMHNMIEGVAVTHKPLDLERHPERWAALYKNPMPCKTCEALARTVMMDQTGHDTRPQPAAPASHVGWLVSDEEGNDDFINNPAALHGRHYKGGAPVPLQPAAQCKGIPRKGCNYLTACNTVCNKCGEVHHHHQMVANFNQPAAQCEYIRHTKEGTHWCALAEKPAAQWVGLTDKEIRNWWRIENGLEDCNMAKLVDFTLAVRAIEAKLKEKNS